MGKLHSRAGRPRKDGRAPQVKFVRYQSPVADMGPLSGEDAMRLLDAIEDPRERASVVDRICGQVACSGAGAAARSGGAA